MTSSNNIIVSFLVMIANATLGIYILSQNRRSEINRLFCALSACFALWVYATFRLAGASSPDDFTFWGRLVFTGPILIAPLFLYFSFIFPRRIKELSRAQKVSMFLPSAAIILMLPTELMFKGAEAALTGYTPILGIGYQFFLAYFFLYIFYAFINITGKYGSSVGIGKMQIRYLFLAVALSFVYCFATSMLTHRAMELKLVGCNPVFSLIFVGTVAYAIGAKRLLSIEFILQKGLIYSLISLLFVFIYIIIWAISGRPMDDNLLYSEIPSVMLFAIIVSVCFQPFYQYFQKASDRLIFGGRYDYRKTLLKISEGITALLKLEELIGLIVDTFLETIKVNEISFMILDEERGKFKSATYERPTGGKYKRMEFDINSPIPLWLAEKKDVLVRDEIEGEIEKHLFLRSEQEQLTKLQCTRDELERLGMAVWAPVILKDRLSAIICLGYKMSGDMYTDEDIGLLKTLMNQVAVALENSVMFYTITMQYEELKMTKDKLAQADKLASLGTMAAGMAHEIKNPLSSLKVMSQLIGDKYDDPEFRQKFQQIVPSEINRIDKIVESLIGFTRLPEPQRQSMNMAEALEEVLADLKGEIEKSGVTLTTRYEEVPPIMADKAQILRAISNIILNAIQAMTKEGTLSIELYKTMKPAKKLIIKVTDTGQGMSPEQLKHIFDPFFTTKSDGTGLGLTITQNILAAHNGTIEVESIVGSGTVVTVALPLNIGVL